MNDRTRLTRLLLFAVVLFLVSAAGSLAVTGSLKIAGGLFLGFILGIAPFASWTWILGRALASTSGRILTAILLIAKLGLYCGALYVFVRGDLVHPVGVAVGITGVVAVMTIGMILPAPAKAGEAA